MIGGQPRPRPRETIQRVGLDPVDWGGSEREEIKKHVAAFKAHQVCFMNEHEEFAVSVLRSMRQRSPCNVALKRLPESR
jgi:hypothetical protein